MSNEPQDKPYDPDRAQTRISPTTTATSQSGCICPAVSLVLVGANARKREHEVRGAGGRALRANQQLNIGSGMRVVDHTAQAFGATLERRSDRPYAAVTASA